MGSSGAAKAPSAAKTKAKTPAPAKTKAPAKKSSRINKPYEPATAYTDELGQRLRDELAVGKSLAEICAPSDMPDELTIRRWLSAPDHPLIPYYAAGREMGYRKMGDDLVKISDGRDPDNDDRVKVERDKLRVNTRQWILTRMLPKVYGDRYVQEITGKDGAALIPEGNTRGLALAVLNIMNEAARTQPDGEGGAAQMLGGMRTIIGLPAQGAAEATDTGAAE